MKGPCGRAAELLFVDDDPEDAEFLRLGFSSLSGRVKLRSAGSVDEALGQLQGGGRPPDMLLLDVLLPGRGGFELLDVLRKGPEPLCCVPAIMLSSSSDPDDVRRAYCGGANGFIRKPADPAGYAKLARCLTEFWLDLATLAGRHGE